MLLESGLPTGSGSGGARVAAGGGPARDEYRATIGSEMRVGWGGGGCGLSGCKQQRARSRLRTNAREQSPGNGLAAGSTYKDRRHAPSRLGAPPPIVLRSTRSLPETGSCTWETDRPHHALPSRLVFPSLRSSGFVPRGSLAPLPRAPAVSQSERYRSVTSRNARNGHLENRQLLAQAPRYSSATSGWSRRPSASPSYRTAPWSRT